MLSKMHPKLQEHLNRIQDKQINYHPKDFNKFLNKLIKDDFDIECDFAKDQKFQ